MPKFDKKLIFNTAIGMAVGSVVVLPAYSMVRSFIKKTIGV